MRFLETHAYLAQPLQDEIELKQTIWKSNATTARDDLDGLCITSRWTIPIKFIPEKKCFILRGERAIRISIGRACCPVRPDKAVLQVNVITLTFHFPFTLGNTVHLSAQSVNSEVVVGQFFIYSVRSHWKSFSQWRQSEISLVNPNLPLVAIWARNIEHRIQGVGKRRASGVGEGKKLLTW